MFKDDLNTANAITVLYEMLKADDLNNNEKLNLIEDFDRVLSLDLLKADEEEKDVHDELAAYIEEMIQKRQEAKKTRIMP